MTETFKAVVLARGLGTRMRRSDPTAVLDHAQSSAAIAGLKGMVPLAGHPFLDYVLSALADAGYRDVCLVVGPEHGIIREWYGRHARPTRMRIGFAIQAKPLGTADAVLSAEGFAGEDRFLVINADNLYPEEALRGLRELSGSGLAAFSRAELLRDGNLTSERVDTFPAVRVTPDEYLSELLESGAGGADLPVSMNCWMFTRAIFRACRAISPSPSGELELPEAARYAASQLGERFRVLFVRRAVLDLTSRGDVAAVAARLSGVHVRL